MKFIVMSMAMLFSFSVCSAQVSTQSAKETSPNKSAVVVKKVASSTTEKSPARQVVPGTQKRPVTPVKQTKPSVIPPRNIPSTTNKDITGYWITANKGAIIQFYKVGDAYYGKTVWQRQSKDRNGRPLTDVNNPDKSKRKIPLLGSQMISNLKYNSKSRIYDGGKVYHPQTGKTFNCKVKLINNNDAMEITAMSGFSLMSKTLTWTRTKGVPSR